MSDPLQTMVDAEGRTVHTVIQLLEDHHYRRAADAVRQWYEKQKALAENTEQDGNRVGGRS